MKKQKIMNQTDTTDILVKKINTESYFHYGEDAQRCKVLDWSLHYSASGVLLRFKSDELIHGIWVKYPFTLINGKKITGYFKMETIAVYQGGKTYDYTASLVGDIKYEQI